MMTSRAAIWLSPLFLFEALRHSASCASQCGRRGGKWPEEGRRRAAWLRTSWLGFCPSQCQSHFQRLCSGSNLQCTAALNSSFFIHQNTVLISSRHQRAGLTGQRAVTLVYKTRTKGVSVMVPGHGETWNAIINSPSPPGLLIQSIQVSYSSVSYLVSDRART